MNYKIKVSDLKNNSFYTKLYSSDDLMKRIAVRGHSIILGRLKSGTIAPPNAPATKEVKRGDKTLQDNGQLLGSIHYRWTDKEAAVASDHIAALVNNPPDNRTEIILKPKKAKYLTIPASYQTRTFMRRYGFSPREVIAGLEKDGWTVWRPLTKNMKRPANIILAQKKAFKRGANNSSKQEAVKLFYLKKSVRMPVRRFLYLTEDELEIIDGVVEDYYEK
jgi:phage gpG-like protein